MGGNGATGELDEGIRGVVALATDQIQTHFRTRLAEAGQDVVKEWKEQQVYPYAEDESKTPLVVAEQQVFDVVAVHVNDLHPTFRTSDLDNKRLVGLPRNVAIKPPVIILPIENHGHRN